MNYFENWQQTHEDNEKLTTTNESDTNNNNNEKIRICKHICEKKKRRCKFNAIRNSDYCVEHLAFNQQVKINKITFFFYSL